MHLLEAGLLLGRVVAALPGGHADAAARKQHKCPLLLWMNLPSLETALLRLYYRFRHQIRKARSGLCGWPPRIVPPLAHVA